MNLAEKYRVKKFEDFVGQESAIMEIKLFLKAFPHGRRRAMILHGPAGTGKTSLVLAAAKHGNLDVFELNASDLRNRAQLEERLKPASEQMSLFGRGKVLLMDEVDGVTGSDRGGIPELVKVINATHFPVIMTCNDIWQSKLSPVRQKSKMVEMKALKLGDIISVLLKVAEQEGLSKSPQFLKQIAIKSQGDVRAAINDLESYSKTGSETEVDLSEKRDVEDNIFNILRKLFKDRDDCLRLFDNTSMSLDEILLWIEENIPREYKNEALAKAYYALGKADVFRGRIYKNQSWRFLIYQNAFQSAGISYAKDVPGEGFTSYEKPKRILKIWLNNQKIAKKKTIARKYATFVHCSTKRVMRDWDLLKPVLKQESVQNKLKMSDEEVGFLMGK
ncbi:MAG: replication factor C large subunit [Nanoarchaeota archaeon]